MSMLRVNHAQPPFNNPEICRALWGALDQTSFMQALAGPEDPSLYHVPLGFFCPDTPMASDVGLAPLTTPRDPAKVKAQIKAAGYKDETVLLMVPANSPALLSQGEVTADLFKQIGLNVDVYPMEFNAMLQRRNRKGPVSEGGWSASVTNWSGTDWLNPAVHISLHSDGEQSFNGWSNSPKTEALTKAWFDAPNETAQKAICRDIQLQSMTDVPFYPLGQYYQPTAYRNTITGILDGFATFWSVRPA
jgi:peptide/nickel transport system substrate-binding protein